jgi:hypothetical protein
MIRENVGRGGGGQRGVGRESGGRGEGVVGSVGRGDRGLGVGEEAERKVWVMESMEEVKGEDQAVVAGVGHVREACW